MNSKAKRIAISLFMLIGFAHAQNSNRTAAPSTSAPGKSNGTPNILFIVMDDVGIDQMKVFGYGGGTPAPTPNIAAIANAGVRFRNTWSMPECSPSRAVFFEGRYPLRTKVLNAIVDDDLANSQVSPFEMTTPKVLKTANYSSAMFGKFHLTGTANNPFGQATPHSLGWDYFDGFLEGAPHPIDTTIGGQFAATSPYTCGFVTNADHGGADHGACRFADNTCTPITKDQSHPTPGRSCVEMGGLFVPNQSCSYVPPRPLNFNLANGYYVWDRIFNEPDGTVREVPLTDPSVRGYISDATTNSAATWINSRSAQDQSWMATVTYANIHSPYQQAPASLLAPGTTDTSNFACTGNSTADEIYTRVISDQMLEAMDTEIGNLMVQTGLATRNSDGSLHYEPEKTNTMVIIVGDNGTFAPGVKAPFDASRAKGFVYQTGVWVPLIVSGPLVASPGRDVTSMINVADLFQLFGDIAGVDVRKVVPKTHVLDSAAMLPYLTNPNQESIRTTNFSQGGNNIHANNQMPPPCVIALTTPPTCAQLFTAASVCADEGGDWYGPGASQQFDSCCAVQAAQLPQYADGLLIIPDDQWATRNDKYKLVRKAQPNCSNGDTTLTEFYAVDEDPVNPKIDKNGTALCDESSVTRQCPNGLNQEQLASYNQLVADMEATIASDPACPGDGNEDKVVSGLDVKWWQSFSVNNGGSSWYDFNYDGLTNEEDLTIIQQHLGTNCIPQGRKNAKLVGSAVAR